MNHPNNPEVAVEVKPEPFRYEVLLTLETVKPIKDVTDLVAGRVWSVDGVIPTVTAVLMGYSTPEGDILDCAGADELKNGPYRFNKVPMDPALEARFGGGRYGAGPLEGVLSREGSERIGGYTNKPGISPEEVAAILQQPASVVEVPNNPELDSWETKVTDALAKAQAILLAAGPDGEGSFVIDANGIYATVNI